MGQKDQKTSRQAETTSSPLTVRIWGARGSLPSPLTPQILEGRIRSLLTDFAQFSGTSSRVEDFLKSLPRHRVGGYGGNTPCVEVNSPKQQLIIDGGSGIRALGYDLLKGPCGKGQGEVHILFTHFH